MKNRIKSMLAFTLSISLFAAGCKPGRENGKDISTEKYTGPYELATPTGTRVASDEPDFPEEIVYWDPQRNLKPEYSPKEAAEKYAFIVNHTTLIYTSCEDLQMRHSFRCVDYGSHLFVNSNGLICLDQSGEILKGNATFLDLDTIDCTSSDQVISELPYKFVGPMGYYSEENSDFDINVIESTEDHVLVHIRNSKEEPSHEALYYGRPVGKTWVLVFCNIWVTQTAHLEDADIPVFTHYAEILFDHLSPDDGTEPYIYDKIVNTPLPEGVKLSGFNELFEIVTSSISLKIRRDHQRDPESSFITISF